MSQPARQPSRLRLAFFVFICVYPVVTVLIYLVGYLTPGWAMWQRTLVMVPVIVLSMIYLFIPRIHRHVGHWL